MEHSFEIGDLLTLKSGGHLMTAVSISHKDGILCAWSVKGDIKLKSFPSPALVKAKEPLTLAELVNESYKQSG